MEEDLFEKIFLRRDKGVNYGLLTAPGHIVKTLATPTYADWLRVLKQYTLIDCFVDARKLKLSQLWSDGNLDPSCWDNTYTKNDVQGLSVMKCLEQVSHNDTANYEALFSRIMRLLVVSCEMATNPVRSPPVLSNIFNNTVHPGSTLSQAHQMLDKPLRVLLMRPNDKSWIKEPVTVISNNYRIRTLKDLQKTYQGAPIGFLDSMNGRITHMHVYSYHTDWMSPDQQGFIEYPEFHHLRFMQFVNFYLPDTADTVTFKMPWTGKFFTMKITDNPDDLRKIFTAGAVVGFIAR